MYQQICSPILWLSFYFVDVFLCCAETFQFNVVHLFFVRLFVSLAWGDISYMLLAMSKILLPMFSSRIFMVSCLTFKSLIHFEFILVCGVRRWSSFNFFVCICPIFPTPFAEVTVYPIVCSYLLCQILIDRIDLSLLLGSLFCSIGVCACFYASTRLF